MARRAFWTLGSILGVSAFACGIDTNGTGIVLRGGPPDVAPPAEASGADGSSAAPVAPLGADAAAQPDGGPPPPPVDAAPDRRGPCTRDTDGDGYVDVACGGDDCCDRDSTVYPRVLNTWFEKANACGNFDFDCDGQETLQFPTAACFAVAGECDGEGFSSPTDCGDTGRFTTCAPAGAVCLPQLDLSDVRRQRCH